MAIRKAADAVGFVVVISIMILFHGIWSSRKMPWEQPRAPRRAFEFARFESCRAVQEGFNAQVRLGSSDSLLAEPGVRPYSDFWYPLYESDYCEYCNCSASSPEPLYDVYMMAAPVAMAAEGAPEGAPPSPSPPPPPLPAMAQADGASSKASSSADAGRGPAAAQDYTGTNNQVDGVDEADVIKTDGTYQYVIPRSGTSLVISQVFPANSARLLSRVNLTQYNLRASDALLDKNVLAVIGSSNVRNAAGTLYLSMAAVHLFDVTDRSNPRMKLAYELEGNSLTARLLNGFVYVVVSTWPTYTGRRRAGTPPASRRNTAPGSRRTSVLSSDSRQASRRKSVVSSDSLPYSLPALRTFAPLKRTLTEREANLDTATAVRVVPVCECEDISYIKNMGTVSGWITVVALSTAGGQFDTTVDERDQVVIKTSTHAGRGECAMMSSEYLYVASTNWDYSMAMSEEGRTVEGGQWTAMLQFALNTGTPAFVRLLTVPGTIINQFAMDQFQGSLRLATTWGDMWRDPPTSQSNVYVYNVLTGVRQGVVEGLAPGERIYSVRFMGGMGFLVTFRQVDPLFVLDLRHTCILLLIRHTCIGGPALCARPLRSHGSSRQGPTENPGLLGLSAPSYEHASLGAGERNG